MTATAELLKPSTNGTVKIARRGMATVQIGEDGLPFSLDVVRTYDEYCDGEVQFCDEANKIPAAKRGEWRKWRHDWAQAVVNDAYTQIGKEPPTLTRAEADMLVDAVIAEKMKLFPTTAPASDAKQSLPGDSETRFSM